MAISKENQDFINSLIDYYINESEAYKGIAENYYPEIESVADTAFGIIVGCVYSGFFQAYRNQQKTPDLEDVKQFHKILKERAAFIKKSILEPIKPESKAKPQKSLENSENTS